MSDRQSHVIRVGDMQVRRRKSFATTRGQSPDKSEISFSERLLRDCALCTAAMLCVMGLGNTDQPVAAMAVQRLSQVATTDLETEEILGQLQFVQNLFPESVQVFWSDSATSAQLHPPVASQEVRHVWAISEPWTEYAGAQSVCASESGEVMSVTPMNDGTFCVRIRHDETLESLYSQLSECSVQEGDWLAQGDQLGYAADALLFEVRKDGRDIDPQALM